MPKGLKPALATLAIAPALYSLFGFLVLPGIALQAINRQLPRFVTQPAGLERLEFNPFTLELTLYRLRLGEADSPALAFERLYGKLHWDSLWHGQLHLTELQLERPQLAVRFDRQGGLNLAHLFRTPASAPAKKKAASKGKKAPAKKAPAKKPTAKKAVARKPAVKKKSLTPSKK